MASIFGSSKNPSGSVPDEPGSSSVLSDCTFIFCGFCAAVAIAFFIVEESDSIPFVVFTVFNWTGFEGAFFKIPITLNGYNISVVLLVRGYRVSKFNALNFDTLKIFATITKC